MRIGLWPAFGGLSIGLLEAAACLAGPVVCTTTLEASQSGTIAPVEVTTCEPTERTSELIERRFFTWTAPYDRGVDLVHQVTDLFGIALAGANGTQLMGLGFPDQTVTWDSLALSATTNAWLEEQAPALPMRTGDLQNGFDSSLALETSTRDQSPMTHDVAPVQALW